MTRLPTTVAFKRRRAPTGFTLIELLIVVTLLAALSAVLAPLLTASPTRTLHAAAGEVATALRETRRQARASQARRRLLIDTGAGQFGIEGTRRWHALPGNMVVQLTTGRSLLTGQSSGGIDYFPDGSSTGGRIVLSLADHALQVDVEWLTGRVRVDEAGR